VIDAYLANAVLLLHLAFILFVALGGFMVWRWPRLAWAHLPAILWGAWIEFSHGICPLTPLENALRQRAGAQGYEGDFVAHYLLPLIYPEGLRPEAQTLLGAGVLILNGFFYSMACFRSRKGMRQRGSAD